MTDVIVIGHGPAGMTAAIYAVRAGLKVTAIGRDSGALQRAEQIENYYGFVEPLTGPDLIARGIEQARRLGVSVIQAEVTGIGWNDHYTVQTNQGMFEAPAVVLATGMPRKTVAVPGVAEFEGRGVSYCAVCDAFFYRNKTVAVIGDGAYALQEAEELQAVATEVHILTNGREPAPELEQSALPLCRKRIKKLIGDDDQLRQVIFADDTVLAVDGVFIAVGTASALDLAKKLGLENDGKAILVNAEQATSLPGLFAAGDCTGGLFQIAKAVGDGARAGMSATAFVRSQRSEKAPGIQWGSQGKA